MDTNLETRFDYNLNGQYSRYLVEARMAGTDPVGIFKAKQPAGEFSDPPNDNLVLVMATHNPISLTRDYGAGRFNDPLTPGSFDLVGPSVPTSISIDVPHNIFIVNLPSERIKNLLAGPIPNFANDFGVLHGQSNQNYCVERIIRQMWNEAKQENPFGNLYADGLLMQLVSELCIASGNASFAKSLKNTQYALSKQNVRRLLDYINAHIDKPLSIKSLAMVVGMSESTFSRSFKNHFSQTPFQFVLDSRLNFAKHLMRQKKMRLCDIAYLSGFSSQQHMTTIFKKRLGITPLTFLKEC